MPAADQANASQADPPGLTFSVSVSALQHLIIEVLRRPVEFTLDAKRVAGYHDELLVLVGTETSTEAGHLLGIGIPDPAYRFSEDARDTLEDVRDLGGTSVAAHPMGPREQFRWSGWQLPGRWGLELLNLDSSWRTRGWSRLLPMIALNGLNPHYAALRALSSPGPALDQWDSLLRHRDVFGIAGADAHLGYPLLFDLVKNYVLLDAPLSGDSDRDSGAILRALASGRSYIGVDGLAPANEFFAFIERGGRRWNLGDTVPPAAGLTLRAGGRLPGFARVRVLKDGVTVAEAEHDVQVESLTDGVYRVEVRLPRWELPWIISNPFYVFGADEADARRRRVQWPSTPSPPALAEMLDPFEGTSMLAPEFDPSSAVVLDLVTADGPGHGEQVGRMRFRLGVSDDEDLETWCALVGRQDLDLSGRTGLTFSLRADGTYRLWVQLRDDNPAALPEGTEWWSDSIRTSREWRQVTVPFSSLRSRDPDSDGRLDLDQIRALTFTLDGGAVKPGTAGTIWLDDLGVY